MVKITTKHSQTEMGLIFEFRLWTAQPKVKNFLPFWKFMKRPQTKFHLHTMRESQVIRSK